MKRAKGLEGSKAAGARVSARVSRVSAPEDVGSADSLADFRVVAKALGKDPEALLSAFAAAWLEALKERVDEVEAES